MGEAGSRMVGDMFTDDLCTNEIFKDNKALPPVLRSKDSEGPSPVETSIEDQGRANGNRLVQHQTEDAPSANERSGSDGTVFASSQALPQVSDSPKHLSTIPPTKDAGAEVEVSLPQHRSACALSDFRNRRQDDLSVDIEVVPPQSRSEGSSVVIARSIKQGEVIVTPPLQPQVDGEANSPIQPSIYGLTNPPVHPPTDPTPINTGTNIPSWLDNVVDARTPVNQAGIFPRFKPAAQLRKTPRVRAGKRPATSSSKRGIDCMFKWIKWSGKPDKSNLHTKEPLLIYEPCHEPHDQNATQHVNPRIEPIKRISLRPARKTKFMRGIKRENYKDSKDETKEGYRKAVKSLGNILQDVMCGCLSCCCCCCWRGHRSEVSEASSEGHYTINQTIPASERQTDGPANQMTGGTTIRHVEDAAALEPVGRIPSRVEGPVRHEPVCRSTQRTGVEVPLQDSEPISPDQTETEQDINHAYNRVSTGRAESGVPADGESEWVSTCYAGVEVPLTKESDRTLPGGTSPGRDLAREYSDPDYNPEYPSESPIGPLQAAAYEKRWREHRLNVTNRVVPWRETDEKSDNTTSLTPRSAPSIESIHSQRSAHGISQKDDLLELTPLTSRPPAPRFPPGLPRPLEQETDETVSTQLEMQVKHPDGTRQITLRTPTVPSQARQEIAETTSLQQTLGEPPLETKGTTSLQTESKELVVQDTEELESSVAPHPAIQDLIAQETKEPTLPEAPQRDLTASDSEELDNFDAMEPQLNNFIVNVVVGGAGSVPGMYSFLRSQIQPASDWFHEFLLGKDGVNPLVVHLPHIDKSSFGIFAHWVQTNEVEVTPRTSKFHYKKSGFVKEGMNWKLMTSAMMCGRALESVQFQNALIQKIHDDVVITSAIMPSVEEINYMYSKTPSDHPLRELVVDLFLSHHDLVPHELVTHEFLLDAIERVRTQSVIYDRRQGQYILTGGRFLRSAWEYMYNFCDSQLSDSE